MNTEGLLKKFNSCWEQVGECHIWRKAQGDDGYGQMRVRKRLWKAHRLSWYLHHGEDPGDRTICHTCDDHLCVNPLHLFPGTQSLNMQDMQLKGRKASQRGELNSQSVLTEEQVEQIREADREGYLEEDIAEVFGISEAYVGRIVRGEVRRGSTS